MKINFKNFVELNDYVLKHGATLFPEDFDWAREIAAKLPKNLDLGLSKVEKTGKISYFNDKKNPIHIQIKCPDRTESELFIPYDAMKRLINGKLDTGKNIKVTMQRLPSDKSKNPSQIIALEIL